MVFTRPLYLFCMVFGKRLHFRIPNLLSWQTWLEKFWDSLRYISLPLSPSLPPLPPSLSLSLPCLLLTITTGCFSISESGTFFLYSSFDVMKYWPIFEARWIWNCVAIGRLIHDNGPRGTVSHVPAENFCRIKCAGGKYKHGQYTRARRVVTPPLAGAACCAGHSCSETCCINTRSTSLYIIRHLIKISSLFAVVACSVW